MVDKFEVPIRKGMMWMIVVLGIGFLLMRA